MLFATTVGKPTATPGPSTSVPPGPHNGECMFITDQAHGDRYCGYFSLAPSQQLPFWGMFIKYQHLLQWEFQNSYSDIDTDVN